MALFHQQPDIRDLTVEFLNVLREHSVGPYTNLLDVTHPWLQDWLCFPSIIEPVPPVRLHTTSVRTGTTTMEGRPSSLPLRPFTALQRS